jgi:hypothetical protein
MYGKEFDLEKEVMKIQLTAVDDIKKTFEVGSAAAYRIRSGQTDPPNSKMLKAKKELGWLPEAHVLLREEWLKAQNKK